MTSGRMCLCGANHCISLESPRVLQGLTMDRIPSETASRTGDTLLPWDRLDAGHHSATQVTPIYGEIRHCVCTCSHGCCMQTVLPNKKAMAQTCWIYQLASGCCNARTEPKRKQSLQRQDCHCVRRCRKLRRREARRNFENTCYETNQYVYFHIADQRAVGKTVMT